MSAGTKRRAFATHAYVVSPRGASKLLELCPRANFHVDCVAWGQPSLRLLCVHPLLASQAEAESTISRADDWIGRLRARVGPLVVDEYTQVELFYAASQVFFLHMVGWPLSSMCGRHGRSTAASPTASTSVTPRKSCAP